MRHHERRRSRPTAPASAGTASASGWISAASPMAPIMVSTQYLVISASAPASPSHRPDCHAALLERIEIGQHHQRQRDELQQIRIVLEALEIEDRIEREHHHDEERAAAVDHAQRDQPADHQAAAERRHRQRIGRPVRDRKNLEPDARDPARQRRMLAIAELEFLAPGEGFRDVHMDVLRRLQIDQDQRPQHRMHDGKADHQPEAGLADRWRDAASHAASRRKESRRAWRAPRRAEIDAVDMAACVARFWRQWNQLGVKKAP